MVEIFFDELKLQGFRLVICVPCSSLSGFIAYASQSNDFTYINATNEGEAVAIAVGAKLSGQKSVIICSNAGLGNMVNPLSSLSDTFGISLLIVMSWRGQPNKIDAPQHKLIGRITLSLLNSLNIQVLNFLGTKDLIKELVKLACKHLEKNNSCCIIVEGNIGNYITNNKAITQSKVINQEPLSLISRHTLLTRKEALQRIIKFFSPKTIFISTTGYTSRELFEFNDSNNKFYMIGSMGYASSIAFGISLYYKNPVVVLDGDGALLMHMGNMSTIGHYAPPNLYHIVLNNKVHATTGGQKNSSESVDFLKVATSCNYPVVIEVDKYTIESKLKLISKKKGPYFIHIEIDSSFVRNVTRCQITPSSNMLRLTSFIKNNSKL